ncbi:hypothetical protein [Oceanobacillus sp. CAU 1775]
MGEKNGFTLIEVFIASSLFLSTVLIFIPIINNMQHEKQILHDRKTISLYLQEELQYFIWESGYNLPESKTASINGKSAQFLFIQENEFIKGCVNWQNAKQKAEEFCIYALAVQ